jgi:hypothetical protein
MAMLKIWGDPKMNKGLKEEYQSLAQGKAPQIINYIPTSEGIVPMPGRSLPPGTQLGKPTNYGKPIPSDQLTQGQQINTLTETLSKVESSYKPEYVGPITGRMAGVYEKTIGVPKEQAAFNSNLAQTKNSLVYLLSGKQINEQEYNRLLEQLPSKELPPAVFESRMVEFKRTLKSIIQNRQTQLQQGGYGTQGNRPPLSSFERK